MDPLALRYALERWNADAWWRQDREKLSLTTPDGSCIPHPAFAQMDTLLDRGAEYWGDADLASLEWLLYRSDGGCVLNPRKGRPALHFFRQEPDGFFFAFRAPDGAVVVPRASAAPGRLVRYVGGEARAFPRAALVDRAAAGQIVRTFLGAHRPAPAVPWVSESALDFRLHS